MKHILISILVSIAVRVPAFAQSVTDSIPNDSVYTIVEVMPKFPGGSEGILHYLSTNLKVGKIDWDEHSFYNESFLARFIVTSTGNLKDIEVSTDNTYPSVRQHLL